jgi:hypothetical protein
VGKRQTDVHQFLQTILETNSFALLVFVYVAISVFSPLGRNWNNFIVPLLAPGSTLVAFSLTHRVGEEKIFCCGGGLQLVGRFGQFPDPGGRLFL